MLRQCAPPVCHSNNIVPSAHASLLRTFSIDSSGFAGFTFVASAATDKQSDRQATLAEIGHVYAMHAMRPKMVSEVNTDLLVLISDHSALSGQTGKESVPIVSAHFLSLFDPTRRLSISVPIQLAQRWFPGLAISNAEL